MVKVGEIYDDYQIIEYIGRKTNQAYFKMKCLKCGNIKICGSSNIARQNNTHSVFNCGIKCYNHMIGKSVNDYIIKEIELVNNQYIATIQCKICGHTKTTPASSVYTYPSTNHSAYACNENYWETIIGEQFGDLIVDAMGDQNPVHRTYLCHCQKCGTVIEKQYNALYNKRGVFHGTNCFKAIQDDVYKSVISSRFYNIQDRCNNSQNHAYKHYGGRGIKLCYEDVVEFYYDFIDEFKEHVKKYGLSNSSFDRIDVDGNYEKNNIRVTTIDVQFANRRNKKYFLATKNEDTVLCDCPGVFAKKNGISIGNLGRAIRTAINGKQRKCSGWLITKVWNNLSEDEIKNIIATESVTTKMLIT